MWPLNFEEFLDACGGRLIFGRPLEVRDISIDSRSISEGAFFVAIKGERFDGHDFVAEALRQGAGALVSIPPVAPPANRTIIHVPNTLKALQRVATYLRRKAGIPVVAITGTNGKTTTKEMIASVLSQRYKVLKTSGNLNNQVGLPMNLMSLMPQHEVAVLEMGASALGDIRELCEIAEPSHGVITNVGMAHLLGFGDLETVRKTKAELLDSVGAAALNADDDYLMQGVSEFKGRVMKYGYRNAGLDVYATDIEAQGPSTSFTLCTQGAEAVPVRLCVPGLFNVSNALGAASIGLMLGLSLEEISAGLGEFAGVAMRLELKELDGAVVISDVYNANPASMEEALKELLRLKKQRAVAVLGDMLELGSYAETAHRQIGRWMARQAVGLFIAVGPMMSYAAQEFESAGGRALRAQDALEARQLLLEHYRSGDTILVKGSRGMRMERVIEGVKRLEKSA